MQRTTHRPALMALVAAVVAFLAIAAVRISAAQSGKPLKEQEVLELLQGGVPSARVTTIVDERGIDFTFTSEIEQKVRDAGGADDVVASLHQASQRRANSNQPRTGSLLVKSTPGETQVYLNDEPKGMTSVEGEIRLPALPTGTYNLRVSLLGYQSYEHLMTIAPGEEQTVYVTLVQKSSAIPAKVDAAPLPTPPSDSTGIPIPGIHNVNVQFYEGPHEPFTEKSKRVYRYSFDRFSARTIFWELDLSFPAPGRQIDFPVEAVWFRSSDGSEMSRQTLNAHVQATWASSWHTLGYGWTDVGHWIPGTYRVDFYCKSQRVASGTFQIN